MNFLINIKRYYYLYFLFFYILAGAFYSLQVGITHDEQYDYFVWRANQNVILNTFFSKNLDTSFLVGGSKFYGSGFHLLSFPIEYLIQFFSILPDFYDNETKTLLSKHVSVFIFFTVSGILVREILKILTNDKLSSNLGSIFYLFYPYLLGHSFFNIKDIPFLSIWLVCTYLIIKITKTFYEKKIIKIKHLFLLSLFTAYLLSIRISGILIFVQYLAFFLILSNSIKINMISFLRRFSKKIIFFTLSFIFFFYLLQPNYWDNPVQFIDAIKFMSKHLQTVCTLTLGDCMPAQNLPPTYIPIWLLFKLPVIILLGFFLYPLIENKLNKNSFLLIIINSLIISSLSIIFLLIIFEVNLYDEIRQIMFLVPLLMIISFLLIINFSKKYFLISLSFFVIFFVFQNIKIYPYNYIWINNFSHFTKITGKFELDYWGVASKPIANFIEKDGDADNCILTVRINSISSFAKNQTCILNIDNLHNNIDRPFYVSLTERSLNKGLPNNCELIHKEVKKINFSNEELILAKLYKCN